MDLIQKAIEENESREDGATFCYREVAKRWGCNRTTLSRRHQMKTRSNAERARDRMLLTPQQELELVVYIEKCTRRGLPPTREMIQNFAGSIAKHAVGRNWVARFLQRHNDEITIKRSRKEGDKDAIAVAEVVAR